jgi:hypothetical protein
MDKLFLTVALVLVIAAKAFTQVAATHNHQRPSAPQQTASSEKVPNAFTKDIHATNGTRLTSGKRHKGGHTVTSEPPLT